MPNAGALDQAISQRNRGQQMHMEAANSQLLQMAGSNDGLRLEFSAAEMLSDALIREELARILRSPIFSLSTRMRRFLRFVVETTLEGRADCLKEYVIGTEVYDRKPPYEPSQDSIVRTEARRLRGKLKEYYESEGKTNPVFIGLRAGSYVPVFAHSGTANVHRPQGDRGREYGAPELSEVLIAVIPFEDVSGDALAKDCARAISDSIALQLMTIERCRVIDAESACHFASAPHERNRVHAVHGFHLVLQGTVARNDKCLRVTSRLADPDGFQLWSLQLDLEAERTHLFGLIDQIASAITRRMRVQDFASRGLTSEERTSSNYINSAILATENLMNQDSPVDCRSIQTRFEAVLRYAPNEARAHCGVADCLVERALSGISDSWETVSQAKCAVHRALELDSHQSSAHACLGLVLALENDFAGAQRSLEHSCMLGPGDAGHRQFALLLTALGRFEEARHHLEKAQVMDPFSSKQKIARSRILYFSRGFEELVQEHECLPIYGWRPAESRCFAAFAYLELRQFEEARQLAHCIRRDVRANPQLMAATAEVFARCGECETAIEIAEHFKLFSIDSPISGLRQALLALALGDEKGAIGALIASYEKREAEVLWVRVDPRFDLVRNTPCVHSLDAWNHIRGAKLANYESQPLFPRFSCLDRFSNEPRVA
jgi:TolB-like protein/tetratricopeptide (TPR) repeat protein